MKTSSITSPVWFAPVIAALLCAATLQNRVASQFALYVALILLLAWGLQWVKNAWEARLESEDDDLGEDFDDPWELQRYLMTISGQETPTRPVLTKGSVLYAALVLEEAGELLQAMSVPLNEFFSDLDDFVDPIHSMCPVAEKLALAGGYCQNVSKDVRRRLERVRPFTIELDPAGRPAKEILDGTTDLTVVNCGLAEACGLPGAKAYNEVGRSNLSKANPVTGRIEQDASGKWIKGELYFAPDLGRVLKESIGA